MQTRGWHPAISGMHASMDLRQQLREEQERESMKHVSHIFPKPTEGHPWYAAKAEAVRLGREFQEIARRTSGGDKSRNQAFDAFNSAQKVVDQLWADWKSEYRLKLTQLRELMGEEAWQPFWNALPDGDAMAPIVDAKLAEIARVEA